MKDHEIIAKIGALLDGADAPTRAAVEAWLRAKYAAPAPAVTLAPALANPVQSGLPRWPTTTTATTPIVTGSTNIDGLGPWPAIYE